MVLKYTADDAAEANMKIINAFGDVVHQKDRIYLYGGIKYDEEWKCHW